MIGILRYGPPPKDSTVKEAINLTHVIKKYNSLVLDIH